jgi:ATP-dependent RNA helicase DHX57
MRMPFAPWKSLRDLIELTTRLAHHHILAIEYSCNLQLVSEVVSHIVRAADDAKGAVLIFLPGVQEIRQCIDTIESSPIGNQVQAFPLHANLTSEEQRIVFHPTIRRKVVVATNVAEVCVFVRAFSQIFDGPARV